MAAGIPWRAVAAWAACTASAVSAFLLVREGVGVTAMGQVIGVESRIAAAEPGRVLAIEVAAGQPVRAGHVLARMDTSLLDHEIAAAEARLRELTSESHASRTALAADGFQATRAFEEAVARAAEEGDQAAIAHQRETAELAQINEEVARQQRLVREGLLRSDRLSELQLRARTLAQTQEAWPARLAALQGREQEAEQRLREWIGRHETSTAVSPREARLQPIRERAAQQQQIIRALRARAAAAVLTSPIDGTVTAVLSRPGDLVRAAEAFLVVSGPDSRQIAVYLNERIAGHVQVGAAATVRPRAAGHAPFTSTVRRLADTFTPIPARFQPLPTVPQWAREAYVDVPPAAGLAIGEAVDVEVAAEVAR